MLVLHHLQLKDNFDTKPTTTVMDEEEEVTKPIHQGRFNVNLCDIFTDSYIVWERINTVDTSTTV